jgi:hypothetical protein
LSGSSCEAAFGRLGEAVTAAREAVEIWRRLSGCRNALAAASVVLGRMMRRP